MSQRLLERKDSHEQGSIRSKLFRTEREFSDLMSALSILENGKRTLLFELKVRDTA